MLLADLALGCLLFVSSFMLATVAVRYLINKPERYQEAPIKKEEDKK